MADVNRGDRAQLLLVAALGVAVLLVTLAVVVNTAIYTESLATRSSKVAGGGEAVGYRSALEEGIGGLIEYVNYHNNTSHGALRTNLSTGVGEWSDLSGKVYATDGSGVNASLASTTNGTRIEQDDATRSFTNASGTATDWTLASDVENTREFRIDVTGTSALEEPGSGHEFNVTVSDGSGTWRLNVTHDASGTEVGVSNVSGPAVVCTTSAEEPWINVTAGTVAGEACAGLEFAEGLSPPYEIAFESGDNVTGTYTLVVDNESLADSPGPHFNAAGGGSPYVTHAVYSATLLATYQSPRLYFNASVRVAPGEPDG